MRACFIIIGFGLTACASAGVRTLGADEIRRHGLTGGVIYDAPLCPTKVDAQGKSQVSGPCEYVTCEPSASSGEIVCRASKKPGGVSF